MANILVMGSVARDEVIHLEEPMREGAHLQGRWDGPRLGGGGANTAVALALAGHRAMLVTAVGSDQVAVELLEELGRAGVDVSQVVRTSGDSTRSVVMVDPVGERTIVNLTRAAEAKPPERLLDIPASCLYVRNRSLALAPLLEAKAKQCTIVAHIPPVVEGAYPAQVLVASESDLDAATLLDPLGAGRQVAGDLLQWVVITRGANGAVALGTDGRVLEVPAPAVETVDSTGAGDAFAAGLVHGLASGLEMPEALVGACAWGAAAVGCESSALTRKALLTLL